MLGKSRRISLPNPTLRHSFRPKILKGPPPHHPPAGPSAVYSILPSISPTVRPTRPTHPALAMFQLPILREPIADDAFTAGLPVAGERKALPMSPREVKERGWDEVDVVFVTGDAYIDHSSFAMAILGRVLEAGGFRVAIISQPDWHTADDWKRFGKPRLFYAISAGNMDSMINHYTASKKVRNDDAYSPGRPASVCRPDRVHARLLSAGARGVQGRARDRGRGRGERCADSPTTTTGATRSAVPFLHGLQGRPRRLRHGRRRGIVDIANRMR